ncbi:hypothetical protein M3Y99_01399500 [Aphelenchoides fujianensis]|nr:hypothetical protein M3Y99_01399500 [Aphelenchoides fujianensis]
MQRRPLADQNRPERAEHEPRPVLLLRLVRAGHRPPHFLPSGDPSGRKSSGRVPAAGEQPDRGRVRSRRAHLQAEHGLCGDRGDGRPVRAQLPQHGHPRAPADQRARSGQLQGRSVKLDALDCLNRRGYVAKDAIEQMIEDDKVYLEHQHFMTPEDTKEIRERPAELREELLEDHQGIPAAVRIAIPRPVLLSVEEDRRVVQAEEGKRRLEQEGPLRAAQADHEESSDRADARRLRFDVRGRRRTARRDARAITASVRAFAIGITRATSGSCCAPTAGSTSRSTGRCALWIDRRTSRSPSFATRPSRAATGSTTTKKASKREPRIGGIVCGRRTRATERPCATARKSTPNGAPLPNAPSKTTSGTTTFPRRVPMRARRRRNEILATRRCRPSSRRSRTNRRNPTRMKIQPKARTRSSPRRAMRTAPKRRSRLRRAKDAVQKESPSKAANSQGRQAAADDADESDSERNAVILAEYQLKQRNECKLTAQLRRQQLLCPHSTNAEDGRRAHVDHAEEGARGAEEGEGTSSRSQRPAVDAQHRGHRQSAPLRSRPARPAGAIPAATPASTGRRSRHPAARVASRTARIPAASNEVGSPACRPHATGDESAGHRAAQHERQSERTPAVRHPRDAPTTAAAAANARELDGSRVQWSRPPARPQSRLVDPSGRRKSRLCQRPLLPNAAEPRRPAARRPTSRSPTGRPTSRQAAAQAAQQQQARMAEEHMRRRQQMEREQQEQNRLQQQQQLIDFQNLAMGMIAPQMIAAANNPQMNANALMGLAPNQLEQFFRQNLGGFPTPAQQHNQQQMQQLQMLNNALMQQRAQPKNEQR